MGEPMVCPSSHKHGLTLNCYHSHNCRCAGCRDHKSAYERARRSATPREPDPYAVELAIEGVPVLMTNDQRAEAVYRLWLRRWSDPAIAARIGVSERTVMRIRHRHGWRAYEMWELQKMKVAA